jgi:N utilization substance protein B
MTNPRTLARQRALQALYQWHLAQQDLALIESQFFKEEDMFGVDKKYFRTLLQNVPLHVVVLDGKIEPLLDREINQLDPIEHTILRMGLYELLYHPDIPWRVTINEAVELAKLFGAEQSHKYINSILDKLQKLMN